MKGPDGESRVLIILGLVSGPGVGRVHNKPHAREEAVRIFGSGT